MPPYRQHHATGCRGLAWLITDDGSRTLWSEESNEAFHSGCGAVAESLVVYLIHSGIADRLRRRQASSVLEVGFGTATDFLLTAAVAQHFEVPLTFTALDNALLPADVLVNLHQGNLSQRAEEYCSNNNVADLQSVFESAEVLLASLLKALNQAELPQQQLASLSISEFVTLNLVLGDALDFNGNSEHHGGRFDAVYFDPFSPESSPSLWTDSVLAQFYAALRPGGTLTTYCVKGHVRRGLELAGFTVQKLPGPVGGKREVLLATKDLKPASLNALSLPAAE